MRNTFAIARKELNIYFTTPIAYVMFCGFTFLASYFFVAFVQEFVQASMIATQMPQYMDPSKLNVTDRIMAPMVFNLGIIFVFAIPFISMRLMAEEKRQNTFELLMTTPLRPTEIVLGKYLGGVVVLALTVLMTLSYPLAIEYFGKGAGSTGSAIEWSTVLSGYLGLFFWACSAMAIGLFVSSLTESQVVAALVTFAVLLLTWVINWIAGRADNQTLKDVLGYLSASQHLVPFVKGELAVQDFLYFFSVIVLGLFLTQRSVESQRWA
jgi:ABC-2 type transport system permease protein